MNMKKILPALIIFLNFTPNLLAQFSDDFDNKLVYDSDALNGWTYYTGDGNAEMYFAVSENGYATIHVDATKDKQGIWWALIRRCVSEKMDLSLLNKPGYEFRIEAKIRVSSAPKRVNLHLNTQRTTDFHSNLMEFDIADTVNWHVISMTTKNFDALPGDNVYGQLALMDWGTQKYNVDIDYFKVDIVNIDSIGPDKGAAVPYHPPIPSIDSFSEHLPIFQDATVDLNYTDMNFNKWSAQYERGNAILLSVSGTQYVIMRWEFSKFKGMKVNGSGLLELTSYSIERSPDYEKDFGMLRVSEIFGGDPEWKQQTVTFDSFCGGQKIDEVINSQMIIDVEVNELKNGKNYITISNPVLQRMIEGKTLGLVIKPLGSVKASFFSMENEDKNFTPKLHFNRGKK